MTDFLFVGSKITEDSDCNHKIKRHLLFGRKAMTNLDSVLKSREIILPAKLCIVETLVFPVVVWMWELDHKEGWELKNWCFWTVVLEKTLQSPSFGLQGDQTSQSWRKSTLNVHWKDWCWSWSAITLTSCEELTHFKKPWCWERLKAGGEADNRGWDGWMASPTQWTWVWANSGK